MNVLAKIVTGAVALVFAFLIFSFGYYQITGHQLGDPTGERLSANLAESKKFHDAEKANEQAKIDAEQKQAHDADTAYLEKLIKADRSDLWNKIDTFNDVDKYRALYRHMVMSSDAIKNIPPENDRQKSLQKSLLACYQKRIDCTSEFDMAYGRTGQDRVASISIANDSKDKADELYAKFKQIADSL